MKELYKKRPIEAEFIPFDDWDDFLIMSREIKNERHVMGGDESQGTAVLSCKYEPDS